MYPWCNIDLERWLCYYYMVGCLEIPVFHNLALLKYENWNTFFCNAKGQKYIFHSTGNVAHAVFSKRSKDGCIGLQSKLLIAAQKYLAIDI